MSEKNVGNKKPDFGIIPRIAIAKKDLGKYMEPQQDVRAEPSADELLVKLSDVFKSVSSLSLMVGKRLHRVDWLQNWKSFKFRPDATAAEIKVIQHNIEIWVRGKLADFVAKSGEMYVISEFVWVPGNDDHEFTLEAYLNPPAHAGNPGTNIPGGKHGGGALPMIYNATPTQPTQPPPPYFNS